MLWVVLRWPLISEGRWQEGQEETQRVRRRLAGRPMGGSAEGWEIEAGVTRQRGGWAAQAAKDKICHGSWRRECGGSVGHI